MCAWVDLSVVVLWSININPSTHDNTGWGWGWGCIHRYNWSICQAVNIAGSLELDKALVIKMQNEFLEQK